MGLVASRSSASALTLVIALLGGVAHADEPVVGKRFRVEDRFGALTITGGFRETFDAGLRQRLRSGFATTVVMRVFLYRREGGRPLAVSARTLRAVYDLWEQTFLLTIEEPGSKRRARFAREQDVVDRLTSFWRFPLGKTETLERGRYFFVAALVEINPMRPELLAEVRRWLRRPSPGRRQLGSGESFFGSFVSIFVNNKIRRAEKTFKVRSQLFFRQR